jgi:general secretion pathway protein G
MKIRNLLVRPAGRQRGFTLIELLVVVAIIGIIATIIIPMFLDALQKSKQKRTMAEMRLVGTCWMSWLTDQISSTAAGSRKTRKYDLGNLTLVPAATVLRSLYKTQSFFYCSEVPAIDAWGFDYEYYINPTSLVVVNVIAIRSRGRDGVFQGTVYDLGPFVTTNYNKDIVWADGMFMTYPAGLTVINAIKGGRGP